MAYLSPIAPLPDTIDPKKTTGSLAQLGGVTGAASAIPGVASVGALPAGIQPTPVASPNLAALGTGSAYNPLVGRIPQPGAPATPAVTAPTTPTPAAAPTPAAPTSGGFQGMDPAGSIDPQTAKTQIEAVLGGQLTPQQLEEAKALAKWDGVSPLTGAQYNLIVQEAAKRSGKPFAAYGGAASGGGAATDPNAIQIPVTDAPSFTPPDLTLPENYTDDPYNPATFEKRAAFQGPTLEDLGKDPGYQFRLQEGTKMRDRAAAAGGRFRTGEHEKAMARYAQGFASEEMDKLYGRKADEYDRTYGNELDIDTRNYGRTADIYDRTTGANADRFNRGVDLGSRRYDAGFQSAVGAYEPTRATWDARTNATGRAAELNFNDRYRRGRDTVSDRFQREDRDWRREDTLAAREESRRRFLAEMGLA